MPRVLRPVTEVSFRELYDGLIQGQPERLLIGRIGGQNHANEAAAWLDVDNETYGLPRITTAEFTDELTGRGHATRTVLVRRAVLLRDEIVIEEGQTRLYSGMTLTPALARIVLKQNNGLLPVPDRDRRTDLFSTMADTLSQLGRQPV